jgi:hypothetical protein
MLLPRLPLLDQILKAPGTYRTEGARIHRRLMPGVWYDAAHCASPAEAERIASQLNAL